MGSKGSPNSIKNRLKIELDPTKIGEKIKYDVDPLKTEREEWRGEDVRKREAEDLRYEAERRKAEAATAAKIAAEERRGRRRSLITGRGARKTRRKPSLLSGSTDNLSETLG